MRSPYLVFLAILVSASGIDARAVELDGSQATVSLGTFPGSLGRHMWIEREVPVLTIELKTGGLKSHGALFKELQDQISCLAK